MRMVADVLAAVNEIAPPELKWPEDPIGLQVGRLNSEVHAVLVTLDATPKCTEYAREHGAEVIVTHHAPIYRPVAHISGDGYQSQILRSAIKNDQAVIAAHTNWDAAPGGVSDSLADALGLQSVRGFGHDIETSSYKLVTFLPESSVDSVLDALAGVGCGQIGLYRRCAFLSDGRGTYEPGEGSDPLIGQVGDRTTTPELRVEVRVPGLVRDLAVQKLTEVHPYDEPAYDLYLLASSEPASLGRVGDLSAPVTLAELREMCDTLLGSRARAFGKGSRTIECVAAVGGAASDYWRSAKRAGADAMVTGEVKHHIAAEAAESGFCIVDAGHYHTEQPGMRSMRDRLAEVLSDVEVILFEPEVGRSGRWV